MQTNIPVKFLNFYRKIFNLTDEPAVVYLFIRCLLLKRFTYDSLQDVLVKDFFILRG